MPPPRRSPPVLDADPPSLIVPEIRDYTRINADLIALLDAGHPVIRLLGVDGQRLIARGLRGSWAALVEVEGDAGPELAADLDAPGLTISCSGSAADGAGRGLIAGRILIRGAAGAAVGYAMKGGTIVAMDSCGPRAGLDQAGGWLVLFGPVGRLAGERQSGGHLIVTLGPVGTSFGHGRRGGRATGPDDLDDEDRIALAAALAGAPGWRPV